MKQPIPLQSEPPLKSPTLLRRRSLVRALGGASFLAVPVFRQAFVEAAGPVAMPRRFVFFQIPGGSPDNEGKLKYFTFDKQLASLAEVQSDVIVFNDLRLRASERNGDEKHGAGMRALLTGSSKGGRTPIITSVDQIMARQIGQATRFSTLHFGSCASEGDATQNRVSFNDGFGMPPLRDPVQMFRRLFGLAAIPDPKQAADAVARNKSVLDYLKGEIEAVRKASGPPEKRLLDQHATTLRELEKQVGDSGMLVQRDGKACALPNLGTAQEGQFTAKTFGGNDKIDVPLQSKLQLDLLFQALNCDLTRIATFQWMPSVDINTHFWWLGFPTNPGHHNLQHNHDSGPFVEMFKKTQTWFTEQSAGFIKRLKATPEGTGSMLDNAAVVIASEMSDGKHSPSPIPSLLAGRGNGAFKTGRVLDCKGVNNNDLLLTIANYMGVPLQTIGDPDLCTKPLALD